MHDCMCPGIRRKKQLRLPQSPEPSCRPDDPGFCGKPLPCTGIFTAPQMKDPMQCLLIFHISA